MTPYQLHVLDWKDCLRCPLSEQRTRVVLGRGSLPADVLFVGEAPGVSEDVLGQPFKGPAGKLLDSIVADSLPPGVRWAMTNLVGCIPLDDDNEKAGEPDDGAIRACSPRLVEFAAMAAPRLIVCVGKLATNWLNTPMSRDTVRLRGGVLTVDITHPAAILRANPAARGIMRKRCVVTIRNAWADVSDKEVSHARPVPEAR